MFTAKSFIEYFKSGQSLMNVPNILARAYLHTTPYYGDGMSFFINYNGMSFFINGKEIYSGADNIYFLVKNLNNFFCKLLESLPNTSRWELRIDSLGYEPKDVHGIEKYIVVEKEKDSLFFSTHLVMPEKMRGHFAGFAEEFTREKTPFVQAIEEVASIVREYRKICFDVASHLVPENANEFMDIIFKNTRLEKKYKNLPVYSGPWLPLEEKWNEFAR